MVILPKATYLTFKTKVIGGQLGDLNFIATGAPADRELLARIEEAMTAAHRDLQLEVNGHVSPEEGEEE